MSCELSAVSCQLRRLCVKIWTTSTMSSLAGGMGTSDILRAHLGDSSITYGVDSQWSAPCSMIHSWMRSRGPPVFVCVSFTDGTDSLAVPGRWRQERLPLVCTVTCGWEAFHSGLRGFRPSLARRRHHARICCAGWRKARVWCADTSLCTQVQGHQLSQIHDVQLLQKKLRNQFRQDVPGLLS